MVQRVKGTARASQRARCPASGVRAILLAHRRKHYGAKSPWSLPGHGDVIAALEAGQPVIVSSALLWNALATAGLPNEDYGRDAPLDGRYWLVDEFDVFSEWTDPHPAEREDDGQHCGGDRPCYRRDPGNTGVQTVEVLRARRQWNWLVLEPESVGGKSHYPRARRRPHQLTDPRSPHIPTLDPAKPRRVRQPLGASV